MDTDKNAKSVKMFYREINPLYGTTINTVGPLTYNLLLFMLSEEAKGKTRSKPSKNQLPKAMERCVLVYSLGDMFVCLPDYCVHDMFWFPCFKICQLLVHNMVGSVLVGHGIMELTN